MPPMFREAARFALLPRNLAILTTSLFATAMVVAATAPVSDPDVWWVAAAGREMLRTGAVPTQNLFSFVEPTHPWLMHEWLLAVPYAVGLGSFGVPFLVGTAIFLLCVTLGLLVQGTLGRASEPAAGLLAALFGMGFFGTRLLTARPTGVALVFPLALGLVAFAPRFRPKHALLAVSIEFVWANTHGSFPLGVVLLAVAALEDRPDRGLRLCTAALASLVTLLNPYGLALHEFVWGYLSGGSGIYREIHRHIYEFRNLHGAWGKTVGPMELTGWVIFVVVAGFAFTERRHRIRAAFCLALLAAAGLQVRHMELAGLLSCVLLVPFLDGRIAASDYSSGGRPSSSSPLASRAWLLAPAYGLGFFLFLTNLWRRAPEDWLEGGERFSGALSTVPDGARLYVPFDRAGMSIWYGFPRNVRVYYDPRNDCYSAETFRDFLTIGRSSTSPERARQLLDAAGANTVLVPETHPLASRLAPPFGWEATRPGAISAHHSQEDGHLVFQRTRNAAR